ncbi:hypothetical protein GC167_05165 [bacterium]|nr:hypothetical protein [bacterium]
MSTPPTPKGGFNWGHGMALTLVLFAALIIGLAVGTFQQNIDLVEPDYAESEERYQDRQKRQGRTEALGASFAIEYRDGDIVIQTPAALSPAFSQGEIWLYKPDNQKLDRRINIALDSEGTMRIPAETLVPGVWKVVVDVPGAQGYYAVESLYL